MRFVRPVQRVLAVLGLGIAIVTFTPLDSILLRLMAGPFNDPKGDILIVLGGDMVGDALGVGSYWRCLYAARVWHEGGFKRVVVAGGRVYPTALTLADRMRDFLICHGVPADDIQVEDRSSSTRENALFTAELLKGTPGRKVLLTSDLHMFRASRVFRKIGFDVAPRPVPDCLKRSDYVIYRYGVFVEVVREAAKTCYYWIRGWI
jgi:uncharacterized SAM-binding protein YcdF (DUF218 family)